MRYVILTLIFTLSLISASTQAQVEIDTTELVKDANSLCIAISTSGWTEDYAFKGDAKVELENIFKKLGLDVGAGGSVDVTNKKYSGVFQKDLAQTISDGNDCRLKAFEMLKEIKLKVLESQKPISKADKTRGQLRGCLSGDILECKRIQAKFSNADVGCKENVNNLKAGMSSEKDGLEVFRLDRYCGNMHATSKSMVALLQNMYRDCSNSLSSNECISSQSTLRNSISSGPSSFNEKGIVDYLTKYSE